MPNKVLFIIPDNGLNGGTVSSLQCIINTFKDIDLAVYPIKRSSDCFFEDLLVRESWLLSAYYNPLHTLSPRFKIKGIFIKILKRVGERFSLDVKSWIDKKGMRHLDRNGNYDIVVGFEEYTPTHIASWSKAKKKVAWVHCDYRNRFNGECLEEDVYKRFDQIVCVSNYTAKTFISCYPRLIDRVIAIHNLFDKYRIDSLSRQVSDVKFESTEFNIISVGRIHPVKRFFLIPQIASYLKNEGLKIRWYLIGSAQYPEDLKPIEDNIEQYSVSNEVTLLGAKANPYPYFRQADHLVSLSVSEACPMIFNEAKVLGLPIVSTDFGSAAEFINDGLNGLISPVEHIGKAISRMIEDTILYNEIKANMRIEDEEEKVVVALNDVLCNI